MVHAEHQQQGCESDRGHEVDPDAHHEVGDGGGEHLRQLAHHDRLAVDARPEHPREPIAVKQQQGREHDRDGDVCEHPHQARDDAAQQRGQDIRIEDAGQPLVQVKGGQRRDQLRVASLQLVLVARKLARQRPDGDRHDAQQQCHEARDGTDRHHECEPTGPVP